MYTLLSINSYLSINSSILLSILLRLIITITEVPLISCHPILIVISFDGFRNDYINSSVTPHMYQLAENGVKGQYLALVSSLIFGQSIGRKYFSYSSNSLLSCLKLSLIEFWLNCRSYEVNFCDQNISQSSVNSDRLL